MKLGDKLYFVPYNPVLTPKVVEVVYNGQLNFQAGEFTFKRAPEGVPYLGSHWRMGRVWATQADYEAWRDKEQAWGLLRQEVAKHTAPPASLTVENINEFLKLLKGQ